LTGGALIWSDGFTTINNHQIYFQEWSTDHPPHARVLLVHGLGEHSSRYDHVGEFFAQAGISITAMDLLGHGKSEGQRGHAESYDEYCDIIENFLKELLAREPSVPIFLYGHSMGGLLALYYSLYRKSININGVISTSPGLAPGFKLPQWKTILGNILYSVFPRFSMDNGLPIEGISHDKAVVDAYKKDPLNHPFISARMGMDLIRNGAAIQKKAGEFPYPLLLMVGSADRLISPQAVIDFGKNTNSLITLKVWEDGYHELHNEPFKKDVLGEITGWINKNVTNAL
jgi:acylglycerol lipase